MRAVGLGVPTRHGRERRVLVVLVLTLGLAGCDSASTEPAPGALTTEVEWRLQAFELSSGTVVRVDDPTRYTALFTEAGEVRAQADCNRCMGPYRTAGASMAIGPLGCTLAACPLPSLGDRYQAALSAVTGFRQTGDELRLNYSEGTLRFGR